MKILHVDCLHGGEWESYWPVAQNELKKHGEIIHHFPQNHNGPWIWTEVLRELGHEVIDFDYKAGAIVKKESLVRHPWGYSLYKKAASILPQVAKYDQKVMNRSLLECIEETKPDIYITYPGELVYPETLKTIQNSFKITTVNWLGRDPIAEKMPEVISAFPHYDHIFTIDPPNVEKFKRYGAKQTHYLPLACYQRIHKPITLSDADKRNYSAKVSFVGTLFDDRPEFLDRIADTGVEFWTHSWNRQLAKKYPHLDKVYRGPARGDRMLKVLNGSDITINRHRAYNSIEGTNMRTFEAAGCKAFQIVEYKKEIENFFDIGEEIEVYYNENDLKRKVEHYLKRPNKRADMAAKAQTKVYANHTYNHRFRSMLETIS